MENTGKKSVIKSVLIIAAGVAVGLAIVKGLDFGFKKITKKA